MNDTEIAKAKRDFELKKAAYDVEVQTKVSRDTYLNKYPIYVREAAKKSSSLNGRAIKRGGGWGVKGRALKEKQLFF